MGEIDRLVQDIEDLRQSLYNMINIKKDDLIDPEVVAASKILNAAITKYNELIKDKTKQK